MFKRGLKKHIQDKGMGVANLVAYAICLFKTFVLIFAHYAAMRGCIYLASHQKVELQLWGDFDWIMKLAENGEDICQENIL